MTYSINEKIEVQLLLGTGLSVFSVCKAAHISYEDLCVMADQFADLKADLKKWYPKYDFEVKVTVTKKTPDNDTNTVKQTENNESEAENEVSKRQQTGRTKKRSGQQNNRRHQNGNRKGV